MHASPTPKEKRGSALLIVLGLLGFLMISAVAFSISMRSEYKAAAAYRKSVIARDLIAVAFADAQSAVEYAFKQQALEAGIPENGSLNDIRKRAYLCPFKSEGEDKYGRFIASSEDTNPETNGDDIAYLLDDRVMRHVPPYVASNVFHTLERANHRLDTLNPYNESHYTINDYARWRPISIKRPVIEAENYGGNTDNKIKSSTFGRMAWAVINLSDSLDINGIGSVHSKRGLGFTGNDIAFRSGEEGDDGLFDSGEKDFSDFTFYSNADLAQYVARNSSFSNFSAEAADGHLFSWAYAASADGEDLMYDAAATSILSPFSVYSFWPATTTRNTEGDSMSISEVNDLISGGNAESFMNNATLKSTLSKDSEIFGESDGVVENYLRLLADYIDDDSKPMGKTASQAGDGFYSQTYPTVENVPMVSEVAYDASTQFSGMNENEVITIIQELVNNADPLSKEDYDDKKISKPIKLDEALGIKEKDNFGLSLPLDKLALKISLGAYYPGAEVADESTSYELTANGYCVVSPEVVVDKDESEGAIAVACLADYSGESIQSDGEIFYRQEGYKTLPLSTSEYKDDIEDDNLLVRLEAKDIELKFPEAGNGLGEPTKVSVKCLVDTFFSAKILDKDGDTVDCAPMTIIGSDHLDFLTNSGHSSKAIAEAVKDYAEGSKRDKVKQFGILDGQFFRVTRSLTATFTLQIQDVGDEGYRVILSSEEKPTLEFDKVTEIFGHKNFGATDSATSLRISSEGGTWYSIDPRYNWVSPMFGLSGDLSSYFGAEATFDSTYSSPHWVFTRSAADLSSTEANPAQRAYQNAHQNYVPFSWGLGVEDIRYTYNNSGKFVFPSEFALVPVPKSNADWLITSSKIDYRDIKASDFHKDVALDSFFRTVPILDFDDGACDTEIYEEYAKIVSKFTGLTDIPEEHRSIMNVYAGQDDYVLAQRLRRLVLRGIPNSIQDAIAVSKARMNEAKEANRIDSEYADKFASDFSDVDEETNLDVQSSGSTQGGTANKFDDFIMNHLFAITSDNPDWPSDVNRPENAIDPLGLGLVASTDDDDDDSDTAAAQSDFVKKISAYNAAPGEGGRLGQNDITSFIGYTRECFGDRQQLFLYILRVDTLASGNAQNLVKAQIGSTTRAVALVWRDAYGELPSRVVYFQML